MAKNVKEFLEESAALTEQVATLTADLALALHGEVTAKAETLAAKTAAKEAAAAAKLAVDAAELKATEAIAAKVSADAIADAAKLEAAKLRETNARFGATAPKKTDAAQSHGKTPATMSHAEFSALSPFEKSAFSVGGGRIA